VNLRLGTGQSVTLGPALAKAGEGTIYDVVGRPDWAAKVFHQTLPNLDHKLAKVAAMTQASPEGAIQPNGFAVLTWPISTLNDTHGLVGYVMPKIATATSVEIHALSNPSNRRDPPPNAPQWVKHATWDHLVNVAANLCLAVEVVHWVGAVIGDFQERNILVSDTTEVTLVDCDSMQFTDPAGRQYLCTVGRPEFTAPELAGIDLHTQPRSQASDLFALAIHIHQLLMGGNHPFLRGEWTGPGEQPAALALARNGDWAGGPSSQLRTHPMAPPVTFLPGEIQQYFYRAFTAGAVDPNHRPTAGQWRAALQRIAVTTCPTGRHQIPTSCAACPWCAIDEARQARRGESPGFRTAPNTVVTPPSTGPIRQGGAPAPQPKIGGMSARTLTIVLIVLGVLAVALSAFIAWALISGRSTTFGAPAPRSISVSMSRPCVAGGCQWEETLRCSEALLSADWPNPSI
jgi:DNA-binding helix-hairpin-helix protein with protein kinase domain